VSPPIIITRRIDAPPETVYEFLTGSTQWSRWQGAEADLEPHPGGLFLMKMPDGSAARGEFVELVPHERVVFTWGWVGHPGVPPGSSTVEIHIERTGEGSLVTLAHRDLPDDELELHRLGWDHYLPRLGAASEGSDPGPDPGPRGSSG
jgi:uncharacterized protein YndB with AHSA1/START domain